MHIADQVSMEVLPIYLSMLRPYLEGALVTILSLVLMSRLPWFPVCFPATSVQAFPDPFLASIDWRRPVILPAYTSVCMRQLTQDQNQDKRDAQMVAIHHIVLYKLHLCFLEVNICNALIHQRAAVAMYL